MARGRPPVPGRRGLSSSPDRSNGFVRHLGCVEDPGDYGYELRTIHTFVLLTMPSPLPDAEVVASDQEGEWPEYPQEPFAPGTFSPTAPLPGPWTR